MLNLFFMVTNIVIGKHDYMKEMLHFHWRKLIRSNRITIKSSIMNCDGSYLFK